jgi:hypothetical protein
VNAHELKTAGVLVVPGNAQLLLQSGERRLNLIKSVHAIWNQISIDKQSISRKPSHVISSDACSLSKLSGQLRILFWASCGRPLHEPENTRSGCALAECA